MTEKQIQTFRSKATLATMTYMMVRQVLQNQVMDMSTWSAIGVAKRVNESKVLLDLAPQRKVLC